MVEHFFGIVEFLVWNTQPAIPRIIAKKTIPTSGVPGTPIEAATAITT